jgi:hypothetical protein
MLSKLVSAVLTYIAYQCSGRRLEQSLHPWNRSDFAQRSDGERRRDLKAFAEVLLAASPSNILSDARVAATASTAPQMHRRLVSSERRILMQAPNLEQEIEQVRPPPPMQSMQYQENSTSQDSMDPARTASGDTALSELPESSLATASQEESATEAGVLVPPEPGPEPAKPPEYLNLRDFLNTKWKVEVYPREDSFMLFKDKVRKSEFTLLDDGSVVWGGDSGGLGTGGQWILREGNDEQASYLEVKRTTGFDIPGLRLPFGRDVWGADGRIKLDEKLQFTLSGIIMSYNAIYPAMIIADWNATRQPGRFIRDTGDDDDED